MLFKRLNRRGSILIFALWAIALMAILAIQIAYSMRQQLHVFEFVENRDALRRAGNAGTKVVMQEWLRRALNQPFSESEARGGISVNVVDHLIQTDPRTDEQKYTELSASDQNLANYGIIDLSRNVNINLADRYVLERLFVVCAGLDPKLAGFLADGVVDYRDEDDYVLSYANKRGSERSYYKQSGLNYSAKNALFETSSELLRVPEMTAAIYEKIRNKITVYGDGSVNIHTAPQEVLLTLDLHPELVEKILTMRKGPDGIAGNDDDFVFGQLAQIEANLSSAFELKESERISLRHAIARRMLTLGSDYYAIIVPAKAGSSHGTTVCIFSPQRGVIRWMET